MAKRQLTQKQKDYIKRRDGHQCQFHTYMKGKGLVRCPNTNDLHVHHIKPFRMVATQFKVVIETPYNLITLCKRHHFGQIHPDMQEALRQYHRDRDSIKKVFVKRDSLVAQQIPYWVQRWDDFFKFLAKEATNSFKEEWPK